MSVLAAIAVVLLLIVVHEFGHFAAARLQKMVEKLPKPAPSQKIVIKLSKTLYGLKQSGRRWNQTVHQLLESLGYKRCISDPCVYYNGNTRIVLYVDDAAIFGKEIDVKNTYDKISKELEVTDLLPLNSYLGFNIIHQDNKVTMNQKGQIQQLLEKYGMTTANSTKTPISRILDKEDGSDNTEYRSVVGALNHISGGTCPEISFAFSQLSSHLTSSTSTHMTATRKVMRYLKDRKSVV